MGPVDRTRNLGDCTKALPLAPPPATPRPCLNGRARSLHVGLLQLLMRILLLPALRSCFSTPLAYTQGGAGDGHGHDHHHLQRRERLPRPGGLLAS